MSNANVLPVLAEPPKSWPMIRAMVGVGLVCGLLIVGVFIVTGPAITKNKARALQAAIFTVLPAAKTSASFAPQGEGFEPVGEGATPGPRVHAGYDDTGALVGLAIEGAGMGYQDTIRVLWGYDPNAQTVVGMVVLESKETPGLGDKIQKDEDFVANFDALDVALTADMTGIANPIIGVKSGEKTEAWQIDGITGATISSMAIADILAQSSAIWLPRLQQHIDDFRKPEAA